MKVATIDLGSNSFLLAIFEMQGGKIIKKLHDQCVITRLSEGVDKSKVLSSQALLRAVECLTSFKETILTHKVDQVIAVSTSAARDASNKSEFLKVGKDLGIDIKIISGQKEAELTFLGATGEYESPKDFVIIDIGGGSTEIISYSDKVDSFSFDIGSVRLTERFVTQFPTSDVEIKNLDNYILKSFEIKKELFKKLKNKQVIAVAGTPTTLVQMLEATKFNEKLVHNKVIAGKQVLYWRDKLKSMSLNERYKVVGLEEKRADVIVAGLSILLQFLNFSNQKQIKVSTKGVRYGLAFSKLSRVKSSEL